jgi:hypothetical protein
MQQPISRPQPAKQNVILLRRSHSLTVTFVAPELRWHSDTKQLRILSTCYAAGRRRNHIFCSTGLKQTEPLIPGITGESPHVERRLCGCLWALYSSALLPYLEGGQATAQSNVTDGRSPNLESDRNNDYRMTYGGRKMQQNNVCLCLVTRMQDKI